MECSSDDDEADADEQPWHRDTPGSRVRKLCRSRRVRCDYGVCRACGCCGRAADLVPHGVTIPAGFVLLAPVVGQLRHTASVLEHDYVRSSEFTSSVGHVSPFSFSSVLSLYCSLTY